METFPSIHSPSPRSSIPWSVIRTPTARWLTHDVAHAGIHALHAFFTHAVMLPQACTYRRWFALKFARPAPNSSQIRFSTCKHMESQGVIAWLNDRPPVFFHTFNRPLFALWHHGTSNILMQTNLVRWMLHADKYRGPECPYAHCDGW